MLRPPIDTSPAYQWGGFAMLLAIAVIVTAWGFELIGGYAPCPLCLQQRWAYYAGIPLLFLALVLVGAEQSRAAALIFLLVALGFLANAGLGVYHAGAEWKFWPGPTTCAAPAGSLASDAGNLLTEMVNARVPACDEAPLRVAGLSFAGWNVVASLLLFTASIKAAFSSREPLNQL